MNQPQLLIETLQPDVASVVITEDASPTGGKNLWLNGIFMQSNVLNQNKRTYPRAEVEREVREALNKIKHTNGILGELDHPDSLQINLPLVSHVITEFTMKGDDVFGRARILCGPDGTPMGNIAGSIAKAGVRLGVSSRGAGSVNESTGEVSDFGLITCDIVANPSAPNAYPKAVMEALEYARNIHKVIDLSEQLAHDPAAQKFFVEEMRKAIGQMIDKGLMTTRGR